MKEIPFIAVEGPIGVGKTSLSKFISQELNTYHLKEIVEENPFLGKFYDNNEEWSFQTEMFFLCNRYKQLEDVNKYYLSKGKAVVSDYHIFKNTIFAEQNLHNGQYEKYMNIYEILTKDMIKPNLVIYLHASLDTLMKRIAFRGRSFEENMSKEYMRNLSDDYELFMETFRKENPETRVLSFNGDQFDFVNREEDLAYIMEKIKEEVLKSHPC